MYDVSALLCMATEKGNTDTHTHTMTRLQPVASTKKLMSSWIISSQVLSFSGISGFCSSKKVHLIAGPAKLNLIAYNGMGSLCLHAQNHKYLFLKAHKAHLAIHAETKQQQSHYLRADLALDFLLNLWLQDELSPIIVLAIRNRTARGHYHQEEGGGGPLANITLRGKCAMKDIHNALATQVQQWILDLGKGTEGDTHKGQWWWNRC